MKIGFAGLGKMGNFMVQRLLKGGHEVLGYDPDPDARKAVEEKGARPVDSLVDLVNKLDPVRIMWCMVPAGKITDSVLGELRPLLDKGDIVVDGGNSFYKDSMRRAEEYKSEGKHFIDAGVSGGIWGLDQGYCIMAGGDLSAFRIIEPVLRSLAPERGYAYIGKSGAGHYIKMVHNGIEYALLESYAEGFEIMHSSEFDLDLPLIAGLWNHGSVVRSWLLELGESVFREDPSLSSVAGYVEDTGEGRWLTAEAINENVPVPVITLSLLQRMRSRQKESFSSKIIAAFRNKFGGHAVKKVQT
jgi:6-phosphogluconate dehydrogenase